MRRVDAPRAGWYPDPESRTNLRYWDGLDWTDARRAPPSAAELLSHEQRAEFEAAGGVPGEGRPPDGMAMPSGDTASTEQTGNNNYAIVDQDGDHFAYELPNLVRAALHITSHNHRERVIVLGRRISRHRPMGLLRGELEEYADRILLDAPCTATGVIRRHPEIKWLRDTGQVDSALAQQRRLLDALWPLLARGGMLLYATCSVLRAENECQVRDFAATRADAALDPIDGPWGRDTGHGRQILPGEQGMDGFFYARIRKTS